MPRDLEPRRQVALARIIQQTIDDTRVQRPPQRRRDARIGRCPNELIHELEAVAPVSQNPELRQLAQSGDRLAE